MSAEHAHYPLVKHKLVRLGCLLVKCQVMRAKDNLFIGILCHLTPYKLHVYRHVNRITVAIGIKIYIKRIVNYKYVVTDYNTTATGISRDLIPRLVSVHLVVARDKNSYGCRQAARINVKKIPCVTRSHKIRSRHVSMIPMVKRIVT